MLGFTAICKNCNLILPRLLSEPQSVRCTAMFFFRKIIWEHLDRSSRSRVRHWTADSWVMGSNPVSSRIIHIWLVHFGLNNVHKCGVKQHSCHLNSETFGKEAMSCLFKLWTATGCSNYSTSYHCSVCLVRAHELAERCFMAIRLRLVQIPEPARYL
jgi:hypothetical protein